MKTLTTFLILLMTMTIFAQTQIASTVDVTGEGIVLVVPDEVTVMLRIENTGKIAKELKTQNDKIVNDVLKFIKSMGIADKDVKTEYITLGKNYEYDTKTYSYAANQSISVKLRDLKKYESLMDGLLESGINRIDGITFSSSNKAALESEARRKAVENAKLKATEYASALNQTIGKAMKISEFSQAEGPQPYFKNAMMSRDSSESGSQSIALGEMEIRTTVNVSFFLY